MKRLFPVVTALAVVVGTGLVQGVWTDRWGLDAAVARLVSGLDRVPRDLGDWHAEVLDSDPNDAPGVAGQLYLRYANRKTGESVAVVLLCGRPGPVSIHTPDVCYGASGFKVGKVSTVTLEEPGGPAEFFVTEAVKSRAAEQTRVRIFWSWYAGGRWQAAGNARVKFAGQKALVKFFVVRELSTEVPPERDPCADFLRLLLPELEKAFAAG